MRPTHGTSMPPTAGPRGAAGDSSAADYFPRIIEMPNGRKGQLYLAASGQIYDHAGMAALDSIMYERGELRESADREHRFTLVAAPRGIHAWLCRIGVHAWELRAASITGRTGHRHRRCAVCRRWETR